MKPTSTKKLTDKERQQNYAELYALIQLGFEIFVVYFHTEHLNEDFKEQLERLYALMWEKYHNILKAYPTARQDAVVFEHYDNLSGVNWELAQDWLIGEPVDPVNGGPLLGAEDYHKNALGRVKSWYYRVGGKKMELAQGSKIKSLCKEAQDALKMAKSVQKLNDNFIPEYTLEWDDVSHEVLINGTYRLAATKDGSSSTKIMTEVMKHKNSNGATAFAVDIGATRRPLSQIMNTDLHIEPLIRKIFFKGSGPDKLRFRSPVTKQQLLDEGVNTSNLDIKLIASGARTEPKIKPKSTTTTELKPKSK